MKLILNKLLQYYQIFCNLSLDVVGGVICNMLAITYCFNINAPKAWYIALPLGTWLIYLVDHIVDVTRTNKDYPTPRHQFIKKYLNKIITLSVFILLLIIATGILFFDEQLITIGFIMIGVIIFHLILTKQNPQSKSIINNKEFGVAFIYATSILIYPLFNGFLTLWFDAIFYLYIFFLLITYQSLLLCSIIEYPIDVLMNNSSFIRTMGLQKGIVVFKGITLSALILLLFNIIRLNFYNPALPAFYFLILAGNYLIYQNRDKLQQHFMYSKIAELLFWLPALALLY
jgi:hypothetical protein